MPAEVCRKYSYSYCSRLPSGRVGAKLSVVALLLEEAQSTMVVVLWVGCGFFFVCLFVSCFFLCVWLLPEVIICPRFAESHIDLCDPFGELGLKFGFVIKPKSREYLGIH